VVGGQVDFHGLPGPASMLTWTRLGATARSGDKAIIVRGDVSRWPVGAPIVIAPTSYFSLHEDVVTITKKQHLGKNKYRLTLNKGLTFNHSGDPLGIPDGFGGYIDETAEVALLRRNIVITGTDEPAPHELEGGTSLCSSLRRRRTSKGSSSCSWGSRGSWGGERRAGVYRRIACLSYNAIIVPSATVHDTGWRFCAGTASLVVE